MQLELEGKVVVVTGGSNGLGRALAAGLVDEGARVALCGRSVVRVESVTAELRAAGGDVVGVVADVTRTQDLAGLVDAALERWGRIDGVVNNAGRRSAGPVTELSDDDWAEDIELKVHAATRLVRLAVPHLRAAGGSIVNVLAMSAKAPDAGSAPSSVSRAAGLALTKVLSKELGGDGIRVNAVLIGLMESGQWEREARARGVAVGDLYPTMSAAAGIPLGRVGRGAEFADLVSYLLSDRSSYVTGTAINLDGGLSPAT